MDTNYLENNYLTLVGKVTGEKKFSHEIYGEKFYTFNLSIPRLSGNADIIPITISERLITDETLTEGKKLLIKGQFRSYNSYENERNKLRSSFGDSVSLVVKETICILLLESFIFSWYINKYKDKNRFIIITHTIIHK